MKVCHGTTSKNLERIMAGGLIPRGRRRGHWDKFPSHPEMVYLTDAFAHYFANMARRGREPLLIIELDLDKLNEWDLFPDEDIIGQSLARNEGWPLERAQRFAIKHFMRWQDRWRDGMKVMGTVAHWGAIHHSMFTRYALLDVKANPRLALITDPTGVSPIHYTAMGDDYRCVQRWVFEGGELPMAKRFRDMIAAGFNDDHNKRFLEQVLRASADRTGIEVVELQHPTAAESKSS